MSQERETNLALFIDFDNVALGARDARQRFDVKLLLQRVLEKGKIIVKKAYADWHYYKEHMTPLHEAAIELIEIPMPRISGKNSADIKLVVDAMDLCYSKDHIDTFVIVSGDSDFSPLVSKLRENNKRVIGIGVRNSSSHLLINNCDEFMFYDDIYRDAVGNVSRSVTNVPADKRDMFDFLVSTAQGLLQESRGVLYSSLIKDTMTRKQPDFNERNYGFGNFGELLEEARRLGLLLVERDVRAGGTWVVQGLGEGMGSALDKPAAQAKASAQAKPAATPKPVAQAKPAAQGKPAAEQAGGGEQAPAAPAGSGSSRSSRRRRGRGRGKGAEVEAGRDKTAAVDSGAPAPQQDRPGLEKPALERPAQEKPTAPKAAAEKPTDAGAPPQPAGEAKSAPGTGPAATRKTPAKKTAARKAPAKKAPAKEAPAKEAPAKEAPARKAPAKKPATRKAAPRKAPAGTGTTESSGAQKVAAQKKTPARKKAAQPRKTPGKSG